MDDNKQIMRLATNKFSDLYTMLNFYNRSILNPNVNTIGLIIDEDEIINVHVKDKIFLIDSHTLNKSKILKDMIKDKNIVVEEDPKLFKHIIKFMQHEDYVYPLNLKSELEQLQSKYLINEGFLKYLRKAKPISSKAKIYIDKANSDINDAFSSAKFDDNETIKCIYSQGVDINFDVDSPNNLDMFSWCVTAHGACNPYFIELLFRFEREDIDKKGQDVFNMSCAYGDTRHIDVFMKRYSIYKWNIFNGLRQTVMHNNLSNLRHLTMYYMPTDEEIKELFRLAYDFGGYPQIILYLYYNYNIKINKEMLLDVMINQFIDTLHIMIALYIEQGESPFDIDKNIITQILSKTSDRLQKIKLLHNLGFHIEDYDNVINQDTKTLPKPTITRHCSFR